MIVAAVLLSIEPSTHTTLPTRSELCAALLSSSLIVAAGAELNAVDEHAAEAGDRAEGHARAVDATAIGAVDAAGTAATVLRRLRAQAPSSLLTTTI